MLNTRLPATKSNIKVLHIKVLHWLNSILTLIFYKFCGISKANIPGCSGVKLKLRWMYGVVTWCEIHPEQTYALFQWISFQWPLNFRSVSVLIGAAGIRRRDLRLEQKRGWLTASMHHSPGHRVCSCKDVHIVSSFTTTASSNSVAALWKENNILAVVSITVYDDELAYVLLV